MWYVSRVSDNIKSDFYDEERIAPSDQEPANRI